MGLGLGFSGRGGNSSFDEVIGKILGFLDVALAELGEIEKMVEKELVNVAVPAAVPSDGSSAPLAQPGMNYYQQLNIPGHTLRTGDSVYVRAENGKQLIAQIDSMWIDSEYVEN